MKDKYGYGDLSYERMEEFERTVYSLISSDEEYAKKFDEFIKEYQKINRLENNVKIAEEELKRFDDNFEKRIIKMHIHDYNDMRKNLVDELKRKEKDLVDELTLAKKELSDFKNSKRR